MWNEANSLEKVCSLSKNSLEKEQIGLIDLPGLGEIGKSVANIHTAGLENEVDQILLIMRPTDAEGYVKEGIAANIDQLRSIQKGISCRSDLIVAAINNDSSNKNSAKTLRNDFENAINSAQISDKIEIKDFEAIDGDSVRNLFSFLIEKLIKALPKMDEDVYNYVVNEELGQIGARCKNVVEELFSLANKIIKTIPLEDSYLDKRTDSLSRNLIFEYEELENEKFAEQQTESSLKEKLEEQVLSIYEQNEKKIKNGLFLQNKKEWEDHAKGRADYVNFLRDDAKRIKAEIANSYHGVDVFYDLAIDNLKSQVLEIFFKNTGKFHKYIDIDPHCATLDKAIKKLIDELDAITRDEEFTQCFKFISGITFKFSQNVFYNIYSSLENLHNPKDKYTETTLQELGEHGVSGEKKISATKETLEELASEGNTQIKDEILAYNDLFNQYLFTCMTFFNDFLYRKDNKRFERNIRSLLKECRDYIIPDDEISIDRDIQKSIKRLKDTIAANDHIAVAGKPTQRKAATQPDASASKISNKNSLQEEENVNKEAQRNSVSANTLAAKPHTKSSKQTHYETAYDDQDW